MIKHMLVNIYNQLIIFNFLLYRKGPKRNRARYSKTTNSRNKFSSIHFVFLVLKQPRLRINISYSSQSNGSFKDQTSFTKGGTIPPAIHILSLNINAECS